MKLNKFGFHGSVNASLRVPLDAKRTIGQKLMDSRSSTSSISRVKAAVDSDP